MRPIWLAVSTPVDSIWVNPQQLLEASDRIDNVANSVGFKTRDICVVGW